MSSAYIQDLNNINSQNPVCVLLKIEIPGNTEPVFICNNNESITFDGNEYLPFGFSFEDLSSAGKGEVPQWSIQIDNTSRAIEQYMQLYNEYLKNNGVNGNAITCTCYCVSLFDLTEAILTEYFELSSFSSNSKYATFVLGAKSPFTFRYPRRRLIQSFCSWKFKGVKCAYSGSSTSCDKSLANCVLLGNTSRFGGFPGMGKGIRI